MMIAAGASALFTIGRQEDPTITNLFATIVTPFPGADPARVEGLVTENRREVEGIPRRDDAPEPVAIEHLREGLLRRGHEARRIDNQLRGRSGRQGDPGSSRFYLSLEDELMRMFGGERAENMMRLFNLDPSIPLESRIIGRIVEQAHRLENHSAHEQLLEKGGLYARLYNTQFRDACR